MCTADGFFRFSSFRFEKCTVLITVLLTVAAAGHAQQPQPDQPQQPATTTAPTTPAPAATQDSSLQPNPGTPAQNQPAQTSPAQPANTPAPPAPAAPPQAAPQQAAPAAAAPEPPAAEVKTIPPAKPDSGQPGAISEEELKQQLVGKQFYLRGGYMGDSLTFDEHGKIVGHPPQASYTLSVIQVDHVHLTKHKVELEGIRYGLHFNEQLASDDSTSAYDKVRITPKKKVVKITIDREMVVNPKKRKEKESGREKAKAVKPALATAPVSGPAPATSAPASPAPATAPPPQATAAAGSAPGEAEEPSPAEQLKASIAATPEAERPADPTSVTTTTSQMHANDLLRKAIDAVLASGLDDRMMAAMPECWKLYYQAVAAKTDYRPTDPSILRQNTVDQKARLLTSFEPESNDFAQAAGVAGMALYHTVIGPDGKPGEIAVARPIGFGLDENAVAAIRKAKFSPAIKGGQPVPVMLDLVVQFRIFSKRTGVASTPAPEDKEKDKPAAPVLPGPYSVPHPQ